MGGFIMQTWQPCCLAHIYIKQQLIMMPPKFIIIIMMNYAWRTVLSLALWELLVLEELRLPLFIYLFTELYSSQRIILVCFNAMAGIRCQESVVVYVKG